MNLYESIKGNLKSLNEAEKLKEADYKIWSNHGQEEYYSNLSREEMIEEIKANGWDEEEINGEPILNADDETLREYLTPQDIDLDYEDYENSILPMIEKQCYGDYLVLTGVAANWRGKGEACKAIKVDELKNYLMPSYDATIQLYCNSNDDLYYTEANHDTPVGGTEMYLYSFKDETAYTNAEKKLQELFGDEEFDMYYFTDYVGYKEVEELINSGILTPVKRDPQYVGRVNESEGIKESMDVDAEYIAHSDTDANNDDEYFDNEEEAIKYAKENDLDCVIKVDYEDGEEEVIWSRDEDIDESEEGKKSESFYYNKDSEDFEELVKRDFQLYLEDNNITEVTEDDINNYFTGLFYDIFDNDDIETANAAEDIIRKEYNLQDNVNEAEDYDDYWNLSENIPVIGDFDLDNFPKDRLWNLRKEITLGSPYLSKYDNSIGINPADVRNFFNSFIEDGKKNNKTLKEIDNPDDLYNFYKNCENPFNFEDFDESEEKHYEEIDSKSVQDSDGFTTDYTLYKDLDNNRYVCVFGDKEVYKPEDEDFDFVSDYEEEAKEWFNDYKGFEDMNESEKDVKDQIRFVCKADNLPIDEDFINFVYNKHLDGFSGEIMKKLKAEYDKSKTKNESEDSELTLDDIVKFMYENYPDASYIGDGIDVPTGNYGAKFDNFPDEAIDALVEKFGNKISVKTGASQYAPELSDTYVFINESEGIIQKRKLENCPEDVKTAVYDFLYNNYGPSKVDEIEKTLDDIKYEEFGNNNENLGFIYVTIGDKEYKLDIDGNPMNEAEKTVPKIKVITDIEWETDGDKEVLKDLPKTVVMPDDINADEAADYLSDKYGWLVNSLDVKWITEDEYKKLTEAEETKSSEPVMVYMNTWKNYNEYGADLEAYGIKDGWMTPEQALEFCKKYAEDEPFINDVDNCPFEVSEYDNAVSKLNEIIRYDKYEDKTLLKNAMETDYFDTIDKYINVLEDGDYIWFPGVSNEDDLGRAYIDMVGFEGVSNKENYFDEDTWKDEVRADEENYYREENGLEDEEDWEEHEGDFEDYLDAIADEMAENYDGSDESLFDYAKLGRELEGDGYEYTSDGCIKLL